MKKLTNTMSARAAGVLGVLALWCASAAGVGQSAPQNAQAPRAVPAHLLAHPLAAAVALVEERLHLLHRPGQRLVPGRPADAVAHPLGVPADLLGLLADGAAH